MFFANENQKTLSFDALAEGAKMNPNMEKQAARLDEIVSELEKTVQHSKIAASHFRSKEVPRGCAHAVATEGHIHLAQRLLQDLAVEHSVAAKL